MSIFKDMLRSGESLFLNTVALDYDFIPKLVPYREDKQRKIAYCIKPLFEQRNGRNLIIHGKPGVGKTVACKHVVNELEEETDEITPIYVNCWQKNTSFRIALDICDQLGYKLTHNKKTEELFDIIKQIVNKKSAVFVFDEVDKLEDVSILYMILEEIYRRTVILITNHKEWYESVDERIRSRLTPEFIEFPPYNEKETYGILKQRLQYAFVTNIWDDSAFSVIAKKTFEIKDVRSGLYLLRESATIAEEKSSRRVLYEHVEEAIKKFDEFTVKDKNDLEDDSQNILELIKSNPGLKIGDLHKLYTDKGGSKSYKAFRRKLEKLEINNFITMEKMTGKEGNTTIIHFSSPIKKLTDF